MVEMSQYLAENPQIIVSGFIKAGIPGALDGNMDSEEKQQNDNTESMDSDEHEIDDGDELDF